jgi:hypothetical protein
MKKQEVSVKIRLLALLVLIPFTATTCWLLQNPEPAPQSSSPATPQPLVPVTPGTATTTPAVSSLTFYVGDDYQPSEEDTGKTAYLLQGKDAPKDFVVTSEDLEDERGVVRFLDGENGTAVSVYFDEGEAFPSLFIVSEEGKEERVYGAFSDYDYGTETFSLTLQSGDEKQTFEGITLNKNVLSAYQNDPSLSDKQNERTRHYVTAVGVWTALMLRHDSLEAEAESLASMNGQWILTGGSSENPLTSIGKALFNIFNTGLKILTYAGAIFSGAMIAVAKVGAAIGVAISAPVVVAVAVVPVAVATSVTSAGDTAANGEEPPEERAAPRLKIWYEDDAGIQPLPAKAGRLLLRLKAA